MNANLNKTDISLLETVADMKDGTAEGAVNIRKDGESVERRSTDNITIRSKKDQPGIDVFVKAGAHQEFCHIPVIMTKTGVSETVYNDFYIEDGADITILAGCGIHNCGEGENRHDGIHTLHIGKNARVSYVEKHYGEGDGNGKNVMNPQTVVHLGEGAYFVMETVQIKGVDSANRKTTIYCARGAETLVTERLQTHGAQVAESYMDIVLDGEGAKGRVVSRSVAQDQSRQLFYPKMIGNAPSFGHVQCDSIIMNDAKIASTPTVEANHTDAQLVHEAAIGKIAGDQLLKLQTLGLTREEAEERILNGFLS